MQKIHTTGELKQVILRVYNEVNQQVSGVGVKQQRVELMRDHFLVIAHHQRIAGLATITKMDSALGRAADIALVDASKQRLRTEWSRALGVRVKTVLKDYDTSSETAATTAILDESLDFSKRR